MMYWKVSLSVIHTRLKADLNHIHLAHRTIYLQRGVLHRDMSANNILMYPCCADNKDRKALESAPPLIQDILSGRAR